ncbi:hypothetical protein TNCV_1819871 [Trichonephila clavipes]|nr:hypothetical protein TNCV_1819871 [Trichonephila clavipes]
MLRRLVGTTAPGHHDCSIQNEKLVIMALYRSPLTVTLWPSSFLNFTPNAAVLFVDVAIQPVRFIAKQNSLMKIGNNGQSRFGPIRRIYALLDHI